MSATPTPAPGDVEARLAEGACRGVHPTRWQYVATSAACDECAHVAAVLAPVVADEVARAVEPFKALADELDTEIAAADRVGRACPDGGCGTCVRHGAAARLRALLGAGQ